MNWLRPSKEESSKKEIIGTSLTEALKSLGISLYRGGVNGPGRWILRGKAASAPDKILSPQPGQYGSYGIYFADHSDGIVLPNNGHIYIVDSSKFEWLVAGSDEWNRLLVQKAEQMHLRIDRIGDGMEAESLLYHKYNVYQPYHGYATIHNEISISDIPYVLQKNKNTYSLM